MKTKKIIEKPLAFCLEHQYSQNGLSFGKLKGKDLAVAESLKRIHDKNLIHLYLGIVGLCEEGTATGGYEDDWNMDDVYETSITIEYMINLNDNKVKKKYNLKKKQVVPNGALSDLETDEEGR